MGTWNNSTKDIVEALDNALDKIEGDFTDKQLQEALEIIKFYPFVCDKRKDGNRYAMVLDKLSELQ